MEAQRLATVQQQVAMVEAAAAAAGNVAGRVQQGR